MLRKQISDIRKYGAMAVFRKGRTLFLLLFAVSFYPVMLCIMLAVHLAKPFVHVRFGRIDSNRIGHFAINTELYLCERDWLMRGSNTYDILYYAEGICNRQLKRMWERIIGVSTILSLTMDRIRGYLPWYREHMIPMPHNQDVHGLLRRTKPHLYFTAREEKKGCELLQELGIPKDKKFICFYARDPLYMDTIEPGIDWTYNDYRNSDIQNYLPAIEELVKRGYYAVRMGSIVKDRLTTDKPAIIDYPNSGMRSDFLDIFLSAKCHFFLSTTGGVASLPLIFRRPVAASNYIPIGWTEKRTPITILIPKKLKIKSENRFMTFPEMARSGAGKFCFSSEFRTAGLEAVENTPSEIAGMVREIEERSEGEWHTSSADEALQKRFWEIFGIKDYLGQDVSRVGTDFLRRNQDLMR